MSGPSAVTIGTKPSSFHRMAPSPSIQRSDPVTLSPFIFTRARHTKPRGQRITWSASNGHQSSFNLISPCMRNRTAAATRAPGPMAWARYCRAGSGRPTVSAGSKRTVVAPTLPAQSSSNARSRMEQASGWRRVHHRYSVYPKRPWSHVSPVASSCRASIDSCRMWAYRPPRRAISSARRWRVCAIRSSSQRVHSSPRWAMVPGTRQLVASTVCSPTGSASSGGSSRCQ
jgi:hypothetical protein